MSGPTRTQATSALSELRTSLYALGRIAEQIGAVRLLSAADLEQLGNVQLELAAARSHADVVQAWLERRARRAA